MRHVVEDLEYRREVIASRVLGLAIELRSSHCEPGEIVETLTSVNGEL